MKGKNIVIILALAIICIWGWSSILTQTVSKSSNYKDYISEADAWVEQGLYQRAILKYEEALQEKETEVLYEKINTAYELRYAEAQEETYDEYYAFLKRAVNAYSGNEKFVDNYVAFCQESGNYKSMYDCLIVAKNSGYDAEKADALILNAKYAFSLTGSERSGMRQGLGGYYTISRNNEWGLYSLEDGVEIAMDYEMAGLCNEDGILVLTNEDSRLVNSEGMVFGIFEDSITDAGIFAEGFIPACSNGIYAYYDEFGKKVFGNYEMAGMFQEGKAAVKQDGKWMLADTEGKEVSAQFEEIILDYLGRYVINDVILVKKQSQTYAICDKDLKEQTEIVCDDMDIYTGDEGIAFLKDGKWGFVSTKGDVMITPQYDEAKSFSNGIAAVKQNGLWGFVDKNENLVIDYQFSDVGYMQENGLCLVRTDIADEVSNADEDYVESWQFLKLEIGIMEE